MHKEVERMMQETRLHIVCFSRFFKFCVLELNRKTLDYFLSHRSTSFQGRLLKHNLDSEVVDALKDLRDKLSENETKR